MAARSIFSESEAAEMRRLIRQKQSSERQAQKALRARLRASFGFYISHYGDFGLEGFTVADFDDLVARGVITID